MIWRSKTLYKFILQYESKNFKNNKRKTEHNKCSIFLSVGGDEGGRTPYLLNAIQALYQLSYTPKRLLFICFLPVELHSKARCILYHLSDVVNRLWNFTFRCVHFFADWINIVGGIVSTAPIYAVCLKGLLKSFYFYSQSTILLKFSLSSWNFHYPIVKWI